VREISRIDSGSVDGEKEMAVDIKEIAVRVVGAARRRSNGSSVTFIVEGEGATAWLPPGRLEQVVENLVDNAAGFSPPGSVVHVSVATDAGCAVLTVRDDGPGIPREHSERIFDRFFSFRPHEKKGAHAGLGLSIVKAIAESHRGTVTVTSPPGGGASFVVRFPAG
jgi:signal transduction histidine kinase